ncbi:MAG: galactokinase [Candidatus Marinimicrobia bacterium]|nr:galactokinase [Candidatus Neomarinimicrobiota bacterium]
MTPEYLKVQFENKFDILPLIIVRSPGRVNLIGEHTDYNDGFVLPAAVDKSIIFALAANGTDTANIYSADMEQSFEFSTKDDSLEKSDLGWPNYLLGVVDVLKKAGFSPGGFDCVFGGDIPIGAGMSSSAALEGGLILGLSKLFDFDISRTDMALLGQKAENNFVGVNCGIMDQFANIHGKDGRVFKLDCRSLDFEYYPFERDDLRIVLCDTQVRRELATSEYNVRRSQCEAGVAILRKYDSDIESLRDVSLELLQKHQSEFDPVVYKRCEYVVEENLRVEKACGLLEQEDFREFGELMNASHNGLSNKYEVSSVELDFLADAAGDIDGVLGSRMMGAGFGGCTINLVQADALEEFSAYIKKRYQEDFGKDALIYVSRIMGGTMIVDGDWV